MVTQAGMQPNGFLSRVMGNRLEESRRNGGGIGSGTDASAGGMGPTNASGAGGGLGPSRDASGGLGPMNGGNSQTDPSSGGMGNNQPDVLALLIEHFDEVDQNGDEFLDQNELNSAGDILQQSAGGDLGQNGEQVLQNLANNINSLMFKSIDPGAAAWFGLSKKDLAGLKNDRDGNQELQETPNPNDRSNQQIGPTGRASRERIAQERGLPDASIPTFDQYVQQTQQLTRQRPELF